MEGPPFGSSLASWREFRSRSWTSSNTAHSYDLAIRSFLSGIPGETPLAGIGPAEVQRVFMRLNGMAGATINKRRDQLHSFFGWARGLELYQRENPVTRAAWPILDEERHRSARSRDQVIITPTILEQILDLVPFWARRAILAMYLLGLRISICWEADTSWIREDPREPGAKIIVLPARLEKTRREHIIPLGRRALAVIGDQVGRIFPEVRSKGRLRQVLQRAGEKLGLGRLSPHQFRKNCCTSLLNAGMPLPAVCAYLGWTQPPREVLRMVQRSYYLGLSGGESRRMSDGLWPPE